MARSRPPRTHRYSMQFKATAVRLSELRDVQIQDAAREELLRRQAEPTSEVTGVLKVGHLTARGRYHRRGGEPA